MKRLLSSMPLFVAVLLITGCASTAPSPAARLRMATQSATFTLNSISDARDAGLISQAEVNQFKPAVDAFIAAQAEAERELRAGETDKIQNALAQVEAAAVPLVPLLTTIDQRKKGP